MSKGQRAVLVILIAVAALELSLTKRLGTIWGLAFGGNGKATSAPPEPTNPHGPDVPGVGAGSEPVVRGGGNG